MNIRSINPKVYLPQEKEKTEARKEIQKEVSVSTNYKEKEGRNPGKEKDREPQREPLSEEEIKQVIAKLKELPGFKKNNLNIRIQELQNKRILYIEDSSGQRIRRIQENDLWTFLESKDKVKGQIFDKAM